MRLLLKLKEIEFYIIMSIPVLFGLITYKELNQCIKKAKEKLKENNENI